MIVTHVIPKHDMGSGKIVGLATINGERRVVLLNFENEYRYLDGQMNVRPVSYGELKDFSTVTPEDLTLIHQGMGTSVRKQRATTMPASVHGRPPTKVNRVNSILITFFLGWLGIHLFLLNKTSMGLLYLLLSWTGIPAVFAIVDLVKLVMMSDEEYAMRYNFQGD